jgi:DNA replication and repair protein RecF
MSARSFASQGQQRSIVLAMKLGEGEVCRDLTGEYPVFLFDDVLSELDEVRREYVLRGGGDRQIIITSCESEEYSKFADREIDVSDGKYKIIY